MVDWAIWNIPLHRRMQTLMVFLWIALCPISLLVSLFHILNPFLWGIVILYRWIWLSYTKDLERNGGHPIQSFRKSYIWNLFASYFPATLIKEINLDPKQRYVFGYHPHGILSFGAVISFGTDATGFSKQFPGLDLRLLTLDMNFKVPIWRELLLALGIGSVGLRSCNATLERKSPTSIVIVVGGAQESLDAHPYTSDLTLKKRKGFIKLAIRHGASLVPTFSFGENELYEQVKNPSGSLLRSIQEFYLHAFGFAPPLFHGRGIFQYDFGLLPQRVPINTIVGRPIACRQEDDPSDEQINQVQEKYIEELLRIYDKYKDIYSPERERDLRLVE